VFTTQIWFVNRWKTISRLMLVIVIVHNSLPLKQWLLISDHRKLWWTLSAIGFSWVDGYSDSKAVTSNLSN